MRASTVLVGSVGHWAAMRCAHVFIICFGLLFFFEQGRPFPWQVGIILVVWFLLAAYLDSYIYGTADEDGVHFRRYISLQFVPWTRIARISWFGKNILSFHLKGGNPLRREMNANSSPKSLFEHGDEEPDLVRWLLVARPPTADGLELRPWGVDTPASRRFKKVMQILIPVISAAILIWLLVTAFGGRT